jgi:hypothetical protein
MMDVPNIETNSDRVRKTVVAPDIFKSDSVGCSRLPQDFRDTLPDRAEGIVSSSVHVENRDAAMVYETSC